MRYLVSYNTDLIRQEHAEVWGVDIILISSDLTANISKLPQDKDSIIFFIPTVLNATNSLSYDGATLALRILMYYIRNRRTDVDIVLIGNESETDFLLQYDYPNILKIPGFHYIRFNKKFTASYRLPPRDQIIADKYKFYLDKLGLKMPSSFKSTHSLTNEWCLYKWNSFMGFNEKTSFLEDYLYFDYIITLEKLNLIKSKLASDHLKNRISNIQASRILVIDDKEGWHSFFKEMFYNTNVNIHYIGEDFSKLEFSDIEKRIVNKVNDFNPHVIILDFRLMEDKDANVKDDMKQISGYRVLAKVLKGDYKNPLGSFGRQVVIFTATSRIENILLLREGNADGFILKEKPENYHGKEITKKVISGMVSTLETAIDRAKFLMPLNEMLDKLLVIKDTSGSDNTEVCISIEMASQFVRQLTQNNSLNENILKLAFLDLFAILESLKKDNKIESLYSYINSEASRISLSSEYFVLWEDICEIRKCLAHGDNKIQKGKLNKKHITSEILLEWSLNLATFILEFFKLYFK